MTLAKEIIYNPKNMAQSKRDKLNIKYKKGVLLSEVVMDDRTWGLLRSRLKAGAPIYITESGTDWEDSEFLVLRFEKLTA